MVGQQLFAGEATRLAYMDGRGGGGSRLVPGEALPGFHPLPLGVLIRYAPSPGSARIPPPAAFHLPPRLQAALRGEGHAILPVPADHPAEAGRLITALAGGTALADIEDDPADPTAVVIATSGSTGNPRCAAPVWRSSPPPMPPAAR